MTWWWVLALSLQVQAPDACEGRLATLDRHRAAAFATADAARLDRVYVDDSPVRQRDAEMIEQYRARGGVVIGALQQVSTCTVMEQTTTTVRLDVVDRLGPAHVRWDDGTRTALPTDQPTRRVLVLSLTDAGWRISGSLRPAPT